MSSNGPLPTAYIKDSLDDQIIRNYNGIVKPAQQDDTSCATPL